MWLWAWRCPDPPAYQDEIGIQIPAPDNTGRLSDLLPVQSGNPDTAVHRPCPEHRGQYRNCAGSAPGPDQCSRLATDIVKHRDKLRRSDSHPDYPNSDPGTPVHQLELKDKPVRTFTGPEGNASPAWPKSDRRREPYCFPGHPYACN